MKTETSVQNERRHFLKRLGAGSLAAIALPVFGNESHAPFVAPPSGDAPDEKYWEQIRKQFAVPPNLIMLNAANLCPPPAAVNEQVKKMLDGLEKDVSFQYREQFSEKRKKAVELLAGFTGVAKEEIGITRNTSESNNIIVNGLDLKPGDEVLLWDQNHPSNGSAWEQRAKRYGFTVKKVSVPATPQSVEDLIKPFRDAITPQTKLLGFSHISNTSGIGLPAKELCKLAAEKNVLTLLDGAQSFGFLDLNLKDIGCDFYTGSTHKWFMGPLENGILYVKKESAGNLWPNIISAGWKEGALTVDEKYCMLGQRNESTLAGLVETVNFHQTIGKKNIENRVVQLNTYLKDQIKSKVPGASFVTPLYPELSGGVTIISFPGKKPAELSKKLYETHGIAAAPTGGIRMSPHIYNTMSDMDKVVKALQALSV
ncbi:aminotransferase class V-fold PLP-dependent enzyme [Dyadobacter pollutisoli]|jgi:selenocysteine lyase/cysteine desulfurase|uniref:Aminotransferase class V-fold PLP-dependent enzyme n=1 Tax=Dyadobacter pollutisoli TaxID=2910158 RepID=A0A9E8SJ92_9BACT|nr:aminotransferase class V-fold PLP-dependent enzyme [Dyadobacter pollutisoli]WAC09466.1 aminotransferase class V-fold PLP-dependent enzyme [Dyadobacter pollutisoli]